MRVRTSSMHGRVGMKILLLLTVCDSQTPTAHICRSVQRITSAGTNRTDLSLVWLAMVRCVLTLSNGSYITYQQGLRFIIDSKTMAHRPRNPTLQDLYLHGIPELTFSSGGCSEEESVASNYAILHEPIQHFTVEPFTIAQHLDDFYQRESMQYMTQALTGHWRDSNVSFGGELDIQFRVHRYLQDIQELSGLLNSNVFGEYSFVNEDKTHGSTTRPDLLNLYVKGQLVNFVKVRTPELTSPYKKQKSEHVLDHKLVLGQVYDFLLNLHSYHGRAHVFAVMTTYQDWRVVWLPHSNEYAQSDACIETNTTAAPPMNPAELTQRRLCGTPIISHSDPALTKFIMTAVLKSVASPVTPIQDLCPDRMYVRLSRDDWKWHNFGAQALTLHANATLVMSSFDRAENFILVRTLQLGSEHKAWLVMAEGTNSLCIVKQMKTAELFNREVELWHNVNKQPCVYSTVVCGKPAVVLPFVVLAHTTGSDVVFNTKFDLSEVRLVKHTAPAHTIPLLVQQQLSAVRDTITTCNVNVHDTAVAAIKHCAAEGVEHKDIEWRHVGVLPVFNKDCRDRSGSNGSNGSSGSNGSNGSSGSSKGDSVVVDLLPVLIDFDRCEMGMEPEVALDRMMTQFSYLC